MVTAPVAAEDTAEPVVWESFLATAYQPACYGCRGITADGTVANPAWNIVAVDTRLIRLGQRLLVRRSDGSCRVYTARDTGGAIRGKKVDILVRSHREAIAFGVQRVEVARIGKDQPTAADLQSAGCSASTPQS